MDVFLTTWAIKTPQRLDLAQTILSIFTRPGVRILLKDDDDDNDIAAGRSAARSDLG